MLKIHPKCFMEDICRKKRPSLTRICLPKGAFKIKHLKRLLKMALNLKHVCVTKVNRDKIEVCTAHKLHYLNI